VLKLVAVATAGTVMALLVPGAALADASPPPGPIQVTGDNQSGYVGTTIDVPGSSTKRRHIEAVSSSSSGDGPRCRWIENSAYLENEYLNFLGWGEPGGHWYDVKCSDGSVYQSLYVPPAPTNVAPQVVLAATLAQEAVNRLALPASGAGVNPTPRALVNLPEWFWVPRESWAALRQRTQAGPVWAIVVARPTSTTWDPGDGSAPFTCAGPGTPYVKSEPADSQRSDCTYTYTRSSAKEPQSGPDPNDRFFTVTVTTTWSVSWTGAGGTGGALPQMTRTSTFRLAVAERDAVVTGGSG
jgi:hypothetical protein